MSLRQSNAAACQRWEDWWERKNTGPLVSVIYPQRPFTPRVQPWMAPAYSREWTMWQHEFAFGHAVELAWRAQAAGGGQGAGRFVEESLDLIDAYRDHTGYAGAGFPFLLANLGAMMMPALLTEQTQYVGDTIWVQADPPWELERIEALASAARTGYATFALAAVRRLVTRLRGRYVLAPPELGGMLDILAGLRGPQNLALDLLDCPQRVHAILDLLECLRDGFRAELEAIFDPANDGCHVECMRYLSASKPTHVAASDFSAMISPDHFAEFYLPTMRREIEHYGPRVVYHLDGPGELPHVPLLCQQEGLHGVQWVPGAGNPDNVHERWAPLYRQLLDAGKRIYFCWVEDPESLKAFFRRWPAREFYVAFTARHAAEGAKLAQLANLG
jgi:5-methyltetrahydrofolate--homocysteine methyltransferase